MRLMLPDLPSRVPSPLLRVSLSVGVKVLSPTPDCEYQEGGVLWDARRPHDAGGVSLASRNTAGPTGRKADRYGVTAEPQHHVSG